LGDATGRISEILISLSQHFWTYYIVLYSSLNFVKVHRVESGKKLVLTQEREALLLDILTLQRKRLSMFR